MDLNQRKLTKSEWMSTEIQVSMDEKEILDLIIRGFHDVNLKYNKNVSLFGFLKIDYSESLEDYLYKKYFAEKIDVMKSSYCDVVDAKVFEVSIKTNTTIKKADSIRIEHNDSPTKLKDVFEYILIELMESILCCVSKSAKKDTVRGCGGDNWLTHYFTLSKLIKMNIIETNRHITAIVKRFLVSREDDVCIKSVVANAFDCIEKNKTLMKYTDMTLYEHQKQLFTVVKTAGPKLVLYIAPTGTGKTLSPIGLSETHRVIFVCAARHVGLALAKSAISMNKKIAVAFGCGSSADIRLHYFAAKDYSKNKRSGGIGKVDNTNGEKVEIIICDIKSFIPSMFYMTAFNAPENIIVYWDEPTITMDYESHDLHEIIHRNWTENIIPNMILSSATLPKLHELTDTITHFKEKFPEATIHNIVSHDCKKSIPLVDKYGYVVLPHSISDNYEDVKRSVEHCENNLTLLRYFDMEEVVRFIMTVEESGGSGGDIEGNGFILENSKIARRFASIDDVNMHSIKLHYLHCLKRIIPERWSYLSNMLKSTRQQFVVANTSVDSKGVQIRKSVSVESYITQPSSSSSSSSSSLRNINNAHAGAALTRMASEQIVGSTIALHPQEQTGIYITTRDAFTLTNGPTIFLANDVDKIAKFCIQTANIPAQVMKDITDKIEFNNNVNEKIGVLERQLEDMIQLSSQDIKTDSSSANSSSHKSHKKQDAVKCKEIGNDTGKNAQKVEHELEMLRSMIRPSQLNETFVPNKPLHLQRWFNTATTTMTTTTTAIPFTSDIDEQTVVEIMMLGDVSDSWKVLLMMGIGVFTNHPSISYTEIMKRLTDQQKLYMIIASSDYIYGTNYQFCHGYLSKDIGSSQEKIIQAMGRIGRNNIQQKYSIRFRDEEQIRKLFYVEENKPEVRIMNKLFCGDVDGDGDGAETDDISCCHHCGSCGYDCYIYCGSCGWTSCRGIAPHVNTCSCFCSGLSIVSV